MLFRTAQGKYTKLSRIVVHKHEMFPFYSQKRRSQIEENNSGQSFTHISF